MNGLSFLRPTWRCAASEASPNDRKVRTDVQRSDKRGAGAAHSGFHVHTAVWVPEDDWAFATRLARYCARNPVALERLTYDRTAKTVTSTAASHA